MTLSLNAEITADGEALDAILDLLLLRQPLNAWPVASQAILARALDDTEGNRFEQVKAVRLRHHLFGDRPIPEFAHADIPGRWVERIRADLADIVPFGSGLHLVAPP